MNEYWIFYRPAVPLRSEQPDTLMTVCGSSDARVLELFGSGALGIWKVGAGWLLGPVAGRLEA